MGGEGSKAKVNKIVCVQLLYPHAYVIKRSNQQATCSLWIPHPA